MRQTCRMDFGTIIIVVSIVAVLVAVASYWGSGRIYRGLGREGGMDMRREGGAAPESSAEVQEEIRQMLEAKSARRQARGEEPLDLEAELAAPSQGPVGADAGLRDEVRQLVMARNERRSRQGRQPLEVDEEVERQLRSLGG
jgi:hypothetical protein